MYLKAAGFINPEIIMQIYIAANKLNYSRAIHYFSSPKYCYHYTEQ